jgi:hypothetical protein
MLYPQQAALLSDASRVESLIGVAERCLFNLNLATNLRGANLASAARTVEPLALLAHPQGLHCLHNDALDASDGSADSSLGHVDARAASSHVLVQVGGRLFVWVPGATRSASSHADASTARQ